MIAVGFLGGGPISIAAESRSRDLGCTPVGAASSRDQTQCTDHAQKGVVHGMSFCGNKADRREPEAAIP